VTQAGGGASQTAIITWGTSATFSGLKDATTYSFSTPSINYNGYQCLAKFSPSTLVASASSVPSSNLTYTCSRLQSSVTLKVTGAPASLSSLRVTLTPNDGSQAISQSIALSNGAGSSSVLLNTNVSYTISSDAVAGYSISFSPQPLIA